MPRTMSRLLKQKNRKSLKIIIEKLALHTEKNGGIDSFEDEIKKNLQNILSFHYKVDELTDEQINLIWEGGAYLFRKLITDSDLSDFIEDKKSEEKKEKKDLLWGKYWIFPDGTYNKCADHRDFLRDNSDIFINKLGVNGLDLLHSLVSNKKCPLSLCLSFGAIIANFEKEKEKKVGRFSLCQCSLPWLKGKLKKMSVFKNYIRILSPDSIYSEDEGIFFIYKRPIQEKK